MAKSTPREIVVTDAAPRDLWIALLGRKDFPVDGVEDYCTFLRKPLAQRGVTLTPVRVNWASEGWFSALRRLRRDSGCWRNRWVLLQYTALSWSRRGFPFLALAVIAILRSRGARVAVVFHEPSWQGGLRWIDHIRGACQSRVIRWLYRQATKAIFTVPLETVSWLPKKGNIAEFIPIGANIPERVNHRNPPMPGDPKRTVIVFVVTGVPRMTHEVEEITSVMREAGKALNELRLVVVGRGAAEAKEQLARALDGSQVELVVRGVLSAEEVAQEFDSAHALLFIRSPITHRRGSTLAGIATGIPVVGYRDEGIVGPIKDAGIEWAPWLDRTALARGLIRVLSDPRRWVYLHERNLQLQKNHLSWNRIAEQYGNVLQ